MTDSERWETEVTYVKADGTEGVDKFDAERTFISNDDGCLAIRVISGTEVVTEEVDDGVMYGIGGPGAPHAHNRRSTEVERPKVIELEVYNQDRWIKVKSRRYEVPVIPDTIGDGWESKL